MNLVRGLVMFALVLPAFAQYAGPAILSRGEAPAAMSAPQVDFAFSVAVSASYTDGLTGVSAPTSQGQLADISSSGEGITVGVSGSHSWKHTHIGLNYTAGTSRYSHAGYFDGLNQGLSLGLSHQFSKHISFSLRESAGMFTQFAPSTVALNSSVPFDPSQSYIPTTDFYDNRTIYNSTQANLTIQKSTRLSFDMGGGYFLNVRRSASLYGVAGESASGDAQYRISRSISVGGNYSFSHFSYTNSSGGAFVHTANFTFSDRISRWTEFSFYGGGSRMSSSFQQTVPINPNLLALFCPPNELGSDGKPLPCPIQSTTFIANSLIWSPSFGLRFSRSFRRGVAYFSAGEGITPGNGLFLTSRAITAGGGYGYSGLRKWSLSIGVNYTTALSIGNVQGGYGSVSGSYSMSRQIVKALSFVSSFTATQYQSPSFSAYNRLIYTASVGIGYSSKNIPVRFF